MKKPLNKILGELRLILPTLKQDYDVSTRIIWILCKKQSQ